VRNFGHDVDARVGEDGGLRGYGARDGVQSILNWGLGKIGCFIDPRLFQFLIQIQSAISATAATTPTENWIGFTGTATCAVISLRAKKSKSSAATTMLVMTNKATSRLDIRS